MTNKTKGLLVITPLVALMLFTLGKVQGKNSVDCSKIVAAHAAKAQEKTDRQASMLNFQIEKLEKEIKERQENFGWSEDELSMHTLTGDCPNWFVQLVVDGKVESKGCGLQVWEAKQGERK